MPILQMEVLTVEAAVEGAAGLHAAVPAHLDDIQVTFDGETDDKYVKF